MLGLLETCVKKYRNAELRFIVTRFCRKIRRKILLFNFYILLDIFRLLSNHSTVFFKGCITEIQLYFGEKMRKNMVDTVKLRLCNRFC